VEGRQLRGRESIALDLVGVVGLSAFLGGLVMLQSSDKLGFDPAEALNGVLSQLSITLPAAVLVLAATALELATGLVLARAARTRPFDSLADALLAAMVAAVLKDTLLLGTLAAFGLFRAPVLIAIDVLIVAALWLPAVRPHLRPLTAFGGWREAVASVGSWPIAALVALVWVGPVILQLASPVVPFIDVLPNYVGPVEHLRTFGWFSPLSATQSPIIGPSRTVLGYDGLLGSLATMTNLSGGLAIAGFILPQTILVAAGAHRLASALRHGAGPIGPWALLAFALSQSFARLADARGTVVVVPLVCIGLAVAAEALRKHDGDEPDADDHRAPSADPGADPSPSTGAEPGPWRIGRGAVIGLALGAATLVHPVIGFFAIVTVGIAGLWRPRELAAIAFVATLTSGLIALPQLATMLGASLPTLALGAWVPLAIAVAIWASRGISRSEAATALLERMARVARLVLVVGIPALAVFAVAASLVNVERLPDALGTGANLVLESSGLLLVALVLGGAVGSRGAGSPIVVSGLAVGAAALLLTGLLPRDLGFLGDALRFEVPKTVHYWLSTIAAVGAAAALAHGLSTDRLPWLVRVVAVGAFVAVAALPIRPKPIDAYHLGEHRYAETFAIDLHYAASGFWLGFPDSRTIVDAPRQEILDAVRVEIDTGRLHHDTPVLHLAKSFQQWVATPLGVFDGVNETFLSLDPEVTHQTVGGRLFDIANLPVYLDGTYPYVVLEPDGLADGLRDVIVRAGYSSIFANDQGEVFAIHV
jgi:hypothetical protein